MFLFLSKTCFSVLDLGLLLWIGGVPFPTPLSNHFSSVGYAGCIRNVTIDNKLLDLEGFIEQRNSERGCSQLYDGCGLGGRGRVCGDGTCVPFVGGYNCICPPQKAGDNCETSMLESYSGESNTERERNI